MTTTKKNLNRKVPTPTKQERGILNLESIPLSILADEVESPEDILLATIETELLKLE